MSDSRFFNIHRTWEDWCGMLLGVLIVLSPWFSTEASYGDAQPSFVILNTLAIGILVFSLAQLEYVALQRWEEAATAAAGLWLIASPYVFGYSGDGVLRYLAFRSRRACGAAGGAAAVAGLGPRTIRTCSSTGNSATAPLGLPVAQRAGRPPFS